MTGAWQKNLARRAAVVGGGLVFLATPGVARADDLGAMGEGMAILFALAVSVVSFVLLIGCSMVPAAIPPRFGRSSSTRRTRPDCRHRTARRTPARRCHRPPPDTSTSSHHRNLRCHRRRSLQNPGCRYRTLSSGSDKTAQCSAESHRGNPIARMYPAENPRATRRHIAHSPPARHWGTRCADCCGTHRRDRRAHTPSHPDRGRVQTGNTRTGHFSATAYRSQRAAITARRTVDSGETQTCSFRNTLLSSEKPGTEHSHLDEISIDAGNLQVKLSSPM